jgi:hypothetical protein
MSLKGKRCEITRDQQKRHRLYQGTAVKDLQQKTQEYMKVSPPKSQFWVLVIPKARLSMLPAQARFLSLLWVPETVNWVWKKALMKKEKRGKL